MNFRASTSAWFMRFRSQLKPPPVHAPVPAQDAQASNPSTVHPIQIAGREQGWLRVLQADELITLVQAQKAVRQMWHQSRLAQVVFERDLLPAVHRYAEFVQLMPASEAHHHAHVGGLLAHTLEMVLAAMTWRNGHFLPTNAPAEQIDAERDQWTYVVFFAALLHDIAKPMTDLRILWRGGSMTEPLRWKPIAGSILSVADGRPDAEYRVEFEPKSQRDYQAHIRLALTLLGQIAPVSALTFLSRTPHAFDALTQYLSGHKTGLLADIVKRADQASTSNALLRGNKAKFATSNAVPLVDLLMQALRSMLVSGTELPLNRSGAAGWVFDGSIWFVAKRLADTTRAWIKSHAPDESMPGEAKNDRLFDTWQEYGILQVNPQSGQAIWHVEVFGETLQEEGGRPEKEEGSQPEHQYRHQLSMLRFPLDRLYDDPALHPPVMAGHIEVRAKRSTDTSEVPVLQADAEANTADEDIASTPCTVSQLASDSSARNTSHRLAAVKTSAKAKSQGLPAPAFNKPKVVTASASKADPAALPKAAAKPSVDLRCDPAFPPLQDGVDGFDCADDGFLDDEESAAAVKKIDCKVTKSENSVPTPRPIAQALVQDVSKAKPVTTMPASPVKETKPAPAPTAPTSTSTPSKAQKLFTQSGTAQTSTGTTPVVLTPRLPDLPHEVAAKKKEPSKTALEFIRWLQQGLASRVIKYNETGAPVHFVEEGMALVSPIIFKLFASQAGPEDQADATGLQVQREVIKAGWHRMAPASGSGKVNILRYQVIGRGNAVVARLAAVVLMDPDRFVLPVPPANPVLKLENVHTV